MVSVTVDCAKLVFGQNISFSAMMEGGRGKKEREKQRGGRGDTHRENGKRKRRRSKGKKEEGKEEEEKRKEGRKEGRKITAKKTLIGSVLRHSHNVWLGHIKLYLNFHFLLMLSLYISQR